MVWFPWLLVAGAFVVGLLIGGVATRFWLVRAGPAIAPSETAVAPESAAALDTSSLPAEPVSVDTEPAAEAAEEPAGAPDEEVQAAPEELPEQEADEETEPLQPASDLQAALQAHQEVLEKLEAKYRNASAAGTDDDGHSRKKGKANARGEP